MAFTITKATFTRQISPHGQVRADRRFLSIDSVSTDTTFATVDRQTALALRDALNDWLRETEVGE